MLIEGVGSPAEINLRDTDLANMRTTKAAGARVLVVADIDRGLLVPVLVGAAGSATEAPKQPPCTHGVSSIGPVEIANGTVVGGSTTPHTESCPP